MPQIRSNPVDGVARPLLRRRTAVNLSERLITTSPKIDLTGARILVIGGAGFVGSHIVDQLIFEPVGEIVVLDNFIRGTHANLESALGDDRVTLVEGTVLDLDLLAELMTGTDYVFHLAAFGCSSACTSLARRSR